MPAPILDAFETLPDSSRLWLLALDRTTEAAELAPEMEALLGRWRHKGIQYSGAWSLLEGRILAIAEPTLAAQPSGCAIDGMLRNVHQALSRLGLGLEDPQAVLARLPEGIRAIPRPDLEARLAEGTLGGSTPILDLSLYSLGDLRKGRLEGPLAATWIGRKFKVEKAAV